MRGTIKVDSSRPAAAGRGWPGIALRVALLASVATGAVRQVHAGSNIGAAIGAAMESSSACDVIVNGPISSPSGVIVGAPPPEVVAVTPAPEATPPAGGGTPPPGGTVVTQRPGQATPPAGDRRYGFQLPSQTEFPRGTRALCLVLFGVAGSPTTLSAAITTGSGRTAWRTGPATPSLGVEINGTSMLIYNHLHDTLTGSGSWPDGHYRTTVKLNGTAIWSQAWSVGRCRVNPHRPDGTCLHH